MNTVCDNSQFLYLVICLISAGKSFPPDRTRIDGQNHAHVHARSHPRTHTHNMKFTIFTPAILATLATSASAASTYSTDAVSCTNLYNKLICDTKFAEADCNAVAACKWTDDQGDASCMLQPDDQTVVESDLAKASTALYDCGADSLTEESACNANANCVYGGETWGCQNEALTAYAALTVDSAPKGMLGNYIINGYEAEKCTSAATEAACTDEQCEWLTMTVGGRTMSMCQMKLVYKAAHGTAYCGTEGGDWSGLVSSGHKSAGAIAVTFAALASAFALM